MCSSRPHEMNLLCREADKLLTPSTGRDVVHGGLPLDQFGEHVRLPDYPELTVTARNFPELLSLLVAWNFLLALPTWSIHYSQLKLKVNLLCPKLFRLRAWILLSNCSELKAFFGVEGHPCLCPWKVYQSNWRHWLNWCSDAVSILSVHSPPLPLLYPSSDSNISKLCTFLHKNRSKSVKLMLLWNLPCVLDSLHVKPY